MNRVFVLRIELLKQEIGFPKSFVCRKIARKMFPNAHAIVRPYWKLANRQSAAPPGGGGVSTTVGAAPSVIRPPAPIDFGALFSNGGFGSTNDFLGKINGDDGKKSSFLINDDLMNEKSLDEIESESKRRKWEENGGRQSETFSIATTSSNHSGTFSTGFGRPVSSNGSENEKNNAKSTSFSHLSSLNQTSQQPFVKKASKTCPKHPNREIMLNNGLSKSATDLTQQDAATQSTAASAVDLPRNLNFSRTSLLSTSGYMLLPSKYTSTADASTETESKFKDQSSLDGLSTTNVSLSSRSVIKIEKSRSNRMQESPALRKFGACQVVSVETPRQIFIRPAYVRKDFEKFERDLSAVYEKTKTESIGTLTDRRKDFCLVENKGEKKVYRVKIVADFTAPPSSRRKNDKNKNEMENRRKFFVDFIDYGYKMVVFEEKLKPVLLLPQYDFVVETAPFVYRCNFLYDGVISERKKSVATSLLKLLLLVENNEFTYLVVENKTAENVAVEFPNYPCVNLMKNGLADTISDIFGAILSNEISPQELSSLNIFEKPFFKNQNFRPFTSNDEDYNQYYFTLDDFKEILEILDWSKVIAQSGKSPDKDEKDDLLVVDRIKKCKILLRRRMVAKDLVDWYNRRQESFDPSNICDDLDVQLAKMKLNL